MELNQLPESKFEDKSKDDGPPNLSRTPLLSISAIDLNLSLEVNKECAISR